MKAAANDPSTLLGAELAGWTYPAREVELMTLAAITDEKSLRRILPFRLDQAPTQENGVPATGGVSREEVEAAMREMEEAFVIPDA